MKLDLLRSMLVAAVTTLALVDAGAAPGSRFVVTSVRVVEAASRLQALDACQRDGLSVGIDWGTGPTGGLLHHCHVRTKMSDLTDGASVLQRLVVLSGSSCPADTTVLARPRNGVVVCASYAPMSSALAHGGDYIDDLAVTKERNYNNDSPGWTTLPYSLHTSATAPTPANTGVFLSIRKPVCPVTELRVLNDVAATDVASACTKTLGAAWRAAGDTGYLDQAGKTSKTVLCAKRSGSTNTTHRNCDNGATARLVDVALVNTRTTCVAGFQTTYVVSSTTKLCAKWEPIANTAGSYIADLALHRVSAALGEGSNPLAAEFLPGNFKLVANRNLKTASAPVYLFTRTTRVASRISTTGDPTFPCRDTPPGIADCTEALMTQWVNDLLDAEKPDFVAFTGDNVETFVAERRQLAMDAVVAGVEARRIPYGMVFGNHDDENGFSREDVLRIAASKPFSYTQRGPFDVDGVGNYELGVQAPVDGPWGAQGTDVYRMYFLDSHGYPDKTKYPHVSAAYDWVKPNQIAYYRQLSDAHAAQQNRVPAVMFFHIPLVEYAANAPTKTNGEQYETVASSDVSTNLFSTLVDLDEVKATFVGHDHVNDYCYERQGIQLCYGGGAGFGRAYASPTFARRARVIEWTVNRHGERTIRSWKRRFGELTATWLNETLYTEAK